MILLILPIVLLYFIFLKIKENFSNNDLDNFYTYKKELPLGEQLVMNVKEEKIKRNEVNVLHDQCSKLSECEDLKNDSLDKGCGYCGATKKFLMGNSEGPFDDVCLEGWAFNAQMCNKNKEQKVCSTIKNCFEIQNNMTNRNCGWCPAKNKAFVYKNENGILKTKYNDDQCNTNLIQGENCFNKELNTQDICNKGGNGPHSVACLRKMWRDVGCSTQSDISKEMDDIDNKYVLKWNKLSIPEIWEDMKQMKLKADLKSGEDYKICYGKDLLETEETYLKPLSTFLKR